MAIWVEIMISNVLIKHQWNHDQAGLRRGNINWNHDHWSLITYVLINVIMIRRGNINININISGAAISILVWGKGCSGRNRGRGENQCDANDPIMINHEQYSFLGIDNIWQIFLGVCFTRGLFQHNSFRRLIYTCPCPTFYGLLDLLDVTKAVSSDCKMPSDPCDSSLGQFCLWL